MGHEVAFATLDDPKAPYLASTNHKVAALGKLGVDAAEQRRPPLWRRFGYTPSIVPWLKSEIHNYDAVIVHSLWNYSTIAARRALAGHEIPYFVFPHGCLDPWFRRTYPVKNLVKRGLWMIHEGPLLNNANAVLFTTHEELALAHKTFRPWRIRPEVVGFGTLDVLGDHSAQLQAFRDAVPTLKDRPYLLYLSRIHPKKGCDLLIHAFAKVAYAKKEVDLVIAGPDEQGWSEHLQREAELAGVAKRIHWTGMISGDVKWGAFRGCDAFVLPSHSENFGIVVAEALACSRPVLTTDKVNLWREIVEDQVGFVESDTQDGVERLLSRFLELTSKEISSMSRRARESFNHRFRMESTASRIIEIIDGSRLPTQSGFRSNRRFGR